MGFGGGWGAEMMGVRALGRWSVVGRREGGGGGGEDEGEGDGPGGGAGVDEYVGVLGRGGRIGRSGFG